MLQWETLIRRDIAFSELENLQKTCLNSVKENPNLAFLLISEPRATYTYGISAKPSELLLTEKQLSERKIEIAKVSRGGQWTYHGPGQIVIYPVVSLKSCGFKSRSIYHFVNQFRDTLRESLSELGVNAQNQEVPFGLYVDNQKIASFGLGFKNHISQHGVALYYTDQSQPLQGIVPCGCSSATFTSLRDRNVNASWEEVAQTIAKNMKKSLISSKTE